ncbi:MAG: hypothetical protein J1E65_06045 [Lachnospiraceae bacterium]|nr:hypothetical protein [Lachnospiraceae bacterium]
MEPQKIRKVYVPYLLENIFGPILVGAIFTGLGIWAGMNGVTTVIIVVIYMGCFFWWCFGPAELYKNTKRKHLQELDGSGFIRNHTFNADGCTVAADVVNGKIAIIFKWNPKQYYVLPANHITNLWVDDGKMLGGSSRVSFLFIVDGVKVRVNTFTSNRVWSMSSNYILEAISKADLMVENLRKAYVAANGGNTL